MSKRVFKKAGAAVTLEEFIFVMCFSLISPSWTYIVAKHRPQIFHRLPLVCLLCIEVGIFSYRDVLKDMSHVVSTRRMASRLLGQGNLEQATYTVRTEPWREMTSSLPGIRKATVLTLQVACSWSKTYQVYLDANTDGLIQSINQSYFKNNTKICTILQPFVDAALENCLYLFIVINNYLILWKSIFNSFY